MGVRTATRRVNGWCDMAPRRATIVDVFCEAVSCIPGVGGGGG